MTGVVLKPSFVSSMLQTMTLYFCKGDDTINRNDLNPEEIITRGKYCCFFHPELSQFNPEL